MAAPRWSWFCGKLLPVKGEFYLRTITNQLLIKDGHCSSLLLWGNILHFKAPWVDHRCELNYIIITETENNYSFMAIFFFLFSLLFSIKPDVFIRSVPTGNAVVKVREHYSEYLFLFHKLILSFLICLFRQQKTSQPVTFSVNHHYPVRVTF